jgi:hypothetical protein
MCAKNISLTLTREQTDRFWGKIEESGFWSISTFEKSRNGKDGARWIIEGAKNGDYHFVDRWSPDDGPVPVIGLLMLKSLAKVKIPAKETY